ncbi:MAG: DNA mismatch repair endonuclease MutL [Bacilli bacterium]|nr:DNA mismatch repair endonuclease MutL [Bacilli bacterium]
MSKIKLMSEDLANKIAAGEVVERCMNVVKELVENAIDAKSTCIKIDLIESGVKEIVVTDDGVGMDKEDATMAFSRHATSKLKTLEDLFNIDSLGFRGEALPSIASVSHVILKTSNGEVGTEVIINGGVIESINNSDLKKGTKITVRDLFYNTPVRLKYLKNLYIELSNIVDYVNKMALSYPNIKFVLTNNGKELLNTDGQNNLLKVIYNIYGFDVSKKMIKVEGENKDYKINGYVSYPEITRSSRNVITTLVNGRVIRNNDLIKTILEAYHTYIPDGKYPIVVLNVEVDPYLIDINIHPTKMDIKFSEFSGLKELINKSITKELERLALIPSAKPLEKSNELKKDETGNISFKDIIDNYIENKNDQVSEETKEYNSVEEITLDFEGNNIELPFEDDKKTRIKKMYPVGLVHGTYIIAENEDGMYMIDQHAANERINYEKYLKAMGTHDNKMIDLLIPIKIELSNSDYIILKENFNLLKELNFEIEEFGINTILIRSHPFWLPINHIEESIRKIIEIIISKESFDSYKFTEKVSITLACKMSIKANDHISLEQMEYLLDTLRETENPFTCPHGRPTIISYSKYELEKLFKRAMN